MGLKWLDNKNWSDITRDERFFCAHLYKAILEDKNGIPGFVRIINEECKLELPENANWELGYEVCFYRDLSFFDNTYECKSPKRTFDLCLFSDGWIVIIEAKAYQPFDTVQVQEFFKDKTHIKELGIDVNVKLVPLGSSRYKPTYDKSHIKNGRDKFRGFEREMLTWDTLAKAYKANSIDSKILANADSCYKSKKHIIGSELLQIFNNRVYRDNEIDPDMFLVGRMGGKEGLKADVNGKSWKCHLYEVNPKAEKKLKGNWFSLKTFAEIVLSENAFRISEENCTHE